MDNDLPRCPDCGRILKQKWENVGFTAPDPEFWDCYLICPAHGEIIPEKDDSQEPPK